jgi:hypothetical protein
VSTNGYDSVRRVRRRVNAAERLTSNGPWYLPGVDESGRRMQVFSSRAALRAAPLRPIDRTETLEAVPSTGRGVWTGTLSTGLARRSSGPSGNGTCNDWDAAGTSDQGISGTVYGMAGDWTDFSTRWCSTERLSLYCFED